jgi:iron complex outermembrane receptor protein
VSLLVALSCPRPGHAQTCVVIGLVQDHATGDPLPGATIRASDTTGTTTNLQGRYELTLPPGTYEMVFSYVGYRSHQTVIELQAGDARILNASLVPGAGQLRTVVVSAGKFEQPIEKVTVSMAVLKPDLIDHVQTTSLESTMEQVPGVTVIDGQANIRGGSGFSYGAGSRVLMLVDDLPMLAADANDVKWTFLPVEQIEQVEVLKGASSALFGSAAMNGVINIRTAFPGTVPETKLTVYHGVYDDPANERYKWWHAVAPSFSGTRVYHGQRIGRLDLTLGADVLDDGGYRKFESESRNRFNANLRYRPPGQDRLSFGVNLNVMQTDGRLFLLWQDDSVGALIPAEGTLSTFRTLRKSFDPFLTYVAPGGGTHKIRTRYFKTDNHNNTDQESFATWMYGEYQYQKHLAQDLVVTGGVTDGYADVTSGLYGNHVSNNVSAYVQGDWSVGRWTFSAGGRVEYFRMDTTHYDVQPVFRSGINYKLFAHSYLRGSFGQGYRFPSIAEKHIRTQVGPLVVYPNDSIQPEKGFTAEIGINQGFRLNTWQGALDVAAFWSEYRDMMEFTFGLYGDPFTDPAFGLGFRSVNIGNTRIQGLDFTITGEGHAGTMPLKVLAGFTIIYPISTTFNAAEDTLKYNTASYNILKYRYRRTFKADVESGYGRFTFGGSVRYNSFMENIDLFFEEAIPGIRHFRETHPNGDWVFDARLYYKLTAHFEAGCIVKNLTNHEYMGRPADLQPPRHLIVQFRMNF